MELQTLKDKLNIINESDNFVGINIHLIKKKNTDDEEILDADISPELAEEFKEIFKDALNNQIIDNSDIELKNIKGANETVNSLFFYDFEEFPEKLTVMENFNPFNNYSTFSFHNDDIENIKAIIITIGNDENYFSIYKHVYPVTIVRQDKMLGLIPIGNRFEKLNSNILQINSSIDFIFTDNDLVIHNLKTLASAYGFNEIVKTQARENLELISGLDLIDNIDELYSFVDNLKYAKRILKIKHDSPVLQIAKPRIIGFITEHPKLSKKIRFNTDGDKILLDTDVSKIVVIGILNDDYLKSNLTDLDYESESKLTIQEEE